MSIGLGMLERKVVIGNPIAGVELSKYRCVKLPAVIIVDYLTKWVEAESLATIT